MRFLFCSQSNDQSNGFRPIKIQLFYLSLKGLMAAEMCLEKMYRFAGEYSGLLFYSLVLSIPSMSFPQMQNDLQRLISD